MNIKLNIFLFIFFLIGAVNLNAQSSYQAGLLPAMNFNKGLKKDWGLNFKIESRQLLQQGVFGEDANNDYKYILSDFSFITAKKIGLNNKIALGYLFRVRSGKIFNRTIQQLTIVNKYNFFRIGYRFAADQTFADGEPPEFRLRYRMTPEIPFNGTSADRQEFYLKINNEYLNSWEENEHDLEIRLVPLVGYKFSENNKTEFGLDYRVNSFIKENSKSSFWISINWYVRL